MADNEQQPADERSEKVAPAAVAGITETDYTMWLHTNPVAQMLMQYLRDYRDDLLKGVMESWLTKGLDLSSEHEMRGYARALEEITTIRIPEIAAFYAQVEGLKRAKEEQEQLQLRQPYGDEAEAPS